MNENWTDKLIDTHLGEPNVAEPPLGFESRLLARVTEQRTTRRRPVFWLIWAPAVVAVVVIAIVFLTRPVSQKPSHVETAKVVAPAQPSLAMNTQPRTAARVPVVHQPSKLNKSVIVAAYPDQFFAGSGDQGFFQGSSTSANAFPSPATLSDQEQRLVAMVSAMTGQQQHALAEKLESSRIPDSPPESVPESSIRPALEIKNTH